MYLNVARIEAHYAVDHLAVSAQLHASKEYRKEYRKEDGSHGNSRSSFVSPDVSPSEFE
jgi:hypothetical protein